MGKSAKKRKKERERKLREQQQQDKDPHADHQSPRLDPHRESSSPREQAIAKSPLVHRTPNNEPQVPGKSKSPRSIESSSPASATTTPTKEQTQMQIVGTDDNVNNNNKSARSFVATMILFSYAFLVFAARGVVIDFLEMNPEWSFSFLKADVGMLVPWQ